MPPPHEPSTTQKLTTPPGRLPAPAPRPPSPPPRCSMLSPGPPPALLQRAARLQPARPLRGARPDPAPPPRRPQRGRPRPARVGGAARGRGPRGVPAPRARRRASTPRHACPAGRTLGLHSGTQGPSLVVWVAVCLGLGPFRTRRGSRSPSTPTWAPGPKAAGHCWSTKDLAPRRPPCPLRSSS